MLCPIHSWRIQSLKLFGAEIGPGVTVYHGLKARGARRISIGARTSIGDAATLDGRGGLSIGKDVNFSSEVQVWTAQHDWKSADFAYSDAPVRIGDRCWLGPRVIVLPGTTIGEGTVVAAGAVAKGNLEPFCLYGGVPAKKLGERPRNIDYQLDGSRSKLWWW
ncbi:acyltransferase [Cryobacterium gelidum]|uniref:Acyltransferase n=2 Tax=Cryobacterium gelidum TaxID=1259164 RepID=A0A4R9AV88_9MICO|nr:acyltransferase [Cryobacterium gelidum]TFD70389.1 acyltransferase [Cryobacterium gelidum]